MNDFNFKYNLIYNSIGILTNKQEIWEYKLDKVKQYIDTNNKRPSHSSKDKEIKSLAKWISHQQENYKKNIQIMSNPDIRKLWNDFINDEKYKSFFKQ